MTAPGWRAAALVAAAAALASPACGPAFVPVRLSEPASLERPPVQAAVTRILVTETVPATGLGDGSMLVVELAVTNGGATPYRVSTASFSCLMAIDPRKPDETRSLLAMGGAAGPFPGELPAERSVLAPIEIAPGETRTIWALFGGYEYPDSDLPRRIVLGLPGPDGKPMTLTLADPATGRLRWNLRPPRVGFVIALQNGLLFGDHLSAMVAGTQLGLVARIGPTWLDAALTQAVVVETKGTLVSATSSFSALGVAARLTLPFYTWGSTQEPRSLGVYAGLTASLLTEIPAPTPAGEKMARPHFYGAYAPEAGLELTVGGQRFAATPFPLTPSGRPLPRWAIRVGYVHWWIDRGGSDGYVSSLRLAW
jgi:hypothetical protein